jgi:hypothetical protein
VLDAGVSPVRDLPHTSADVSRRQQTSADADASPVRDENNQPNVVAPDGALEMRRSPPFDVSRKAFSCINENALLQSPQARPSEEEEKKKKERNAKMEEEEALARGIDEAFR